MPVEHSVNSSAYVLNDPFPHHVPVFLRRPPCLECHPAPQWSVHWDMWRRLLGEQWIFCWCSRCDGCAGRSWGMGGIWWWAHRIFGTRIVFWSGGCRRRGIICVTPPVSCKLHKSIHFQNSEIFYCATARRASVVDSSLFFCFFLSWIRCEAVRENKWSWDDVAVEDYWNGGKRNEKHPRSTQLLFLNPAEWWKGKKKNTWKEYTVTVRGWVCASLKNALGCSPKAQRWGRV